MHRYIDERKISMAKVTMFMLCDSVNNLPGPQGVIPHLVAPQLVLRPMFIPGNFSFGISIGVQGLNLKVPTKLGFTITDPNGVVLQKAEDAEIPAVEQVDTLPPEQQGLMLNLDIRNLVVQEEGVYKFTLRVNGEPLEDQSIPIYRGIPHG